MLMSESEKLPHSYGPELRTQAESKSAPKRAKARLQSPTTAHKGIVSLLVVGQVRATANKP